MNNKPLVSIIVPSFNVEAYVKKCLDSIKQQTYDNWECIIVDRPSTKDKTTTLIKEYIKGDKRFRFIKQINKGVSDGRNVGFAAAKGKYIQFTDPDDWMSPKLLELSVKRAELTNAEIVQFGWSNYYVQTERYVDTGFMPYARELPTIFSIKNKANEIFNHGEFYINSMSKLWLKEFLQQNKLHYPLDLKRAEDLAEVSRLVMNASRITYLDEVLYYYKIDEYVGDSLSNFISNDSHNLDFYKAIIIVYKNMNKFGLLPDLKNAFCQVAISNSLHALHMSKFNISANKEIYDCIRSQIFPMVSLELKQMNPELYETFGDCDYYKYLQKRLDDATSSGIEKQSRIEHLRIENLRLSGILNEHLGVKRSAKLTLGNIRRKFNHRKQEKNT